MINMGLVVITFLVIGANVVAAETWGVKELRIAQEAALSHFKDVQGSSLYDAISGFSIERNSSGNSGRAKINYKEGDQVKSVSYFCHVHEGTEIDCH